MWIKNLTRFANIGRSNPSTMPPVTATLAKEECITDKSLVDSSFHGSVMPKAVMAPYPLSGAN